MNVDNHLTNAESRRFAWVMVIVMALFLLAPVPSFAQATGTILGVVKDTSGGVVPQAKVTVVNTDTNDTRTAITGDDGSFRFPALLPGHYTVRTEKEGFQTQTQTGITLEVTQELVVNPALQVGSSTQEVTVTGEAPLVNTTNSSLGGLVNEQKMADLPLNGRNYTDLTFMQPGVAVNPNSSQSSTGGGGRGTFFSSNGSPLRSNMFTLDGNILLNGRGGTTSSESGTTLGVDGIKEFKVQTGVFGAEYGVSAATQVVMVSKGGTNQFHGDAFEYLRNSVLDAANFFDVPVAANGFQRLPAFVRNNFGGSVGGPIKKDKTFFYGVYEGLRQRFGATIIDTVPGAGCHGTAGQQIWNGVSPQPAGSVGNCPQLGGSTPSATPISNVIAPILALYPTPNVPGVANQFTFPSANPSDVDYGQMRVDHTISATDTLFGRYTTDKSSLITSNVTTGTPTSIGFPQFEVGYLSYDQFATISENHIFSPSLLNTWRFSYSRTHYNENNIYPLGTASLISPQVSFVQGQVIGGVSITGLSAFGPNGANPAGVTQNIYTLGDDIYYQKGKHALKFGVALNKWNEGIHTSGARGSLAFTSLANFLTGTTSSYSQLISSPQTPDNARNYMWQVDGFYVQDDYRVKSRLTLNLGLRYEFTTAPHETNGFGYALHNPFTDSAFTAGTFIAPQPKTNFSPRIGFAWDVFGNGKTAVRGGFGDYFDIGNYAALIYGTTNGGSPPLNYTLTHIGPVSSLPLTFLPTDQFALHTNAYYITNPYLLKWNLSVERQLPFSMGLQVSYVGTRGEHLFQAQEGNPDVPVSIVNGVPYWSTAAGFAVRTNPNFQGDLWTNTVGWSIYHGLQVALNKHLTHGLEGQVAYSYSRVLDSAQSEFGTSDCSTASGMNNPPISIYGNTTVLDKGPACFDVPHNLRVNLLYHLPNIKSDNFAAKLEHGWWVGSIISAQSGYPFTPILGTDRSEQDGAVNSSNSFYPDVGTSTTGLFIPFNQSTVIEHKVSQWFNPYMFQLQPIAACPTNAAISCGRPGDVSRGLLRGPGLTDFDFSINKDTALPFLGEQGMIEFRAEIFNAFNHPNFSMPNGEVFVGSLKDTSPYAESAFGSAGVISATVGTSRQLQFALKLIF